MTECREIELCINPVAVSKERVLASFKALAEMKIEENDDFPIYHHLGMDKGGISFALFDNGESLLMFETYTFAEIKREYGFGKKKFISLVHQWFDDMDVDSAFQQFLIPFEDENGCPGFVALMGLTGAEEEIAGYLDAFAEILKHFASTFDDWLDCEGYTPRSGY